MKGEGRRDSHQWSLSSREGIDPSESTKQHYSRKNEQHSLRGKELVANVESQNGSRKYSKICGGWDLEGRRGWGTGEGREERTWGASFTGRRECLTKNVESLSAPEDAWSCVCHPPSGGDIIRAPKEAKRGGKGKEAKPKLIPRAGGGG